MVFDTEFALDGEWAGDGFCLSQNDADRRKYKPFGDPGEDLLHLDLAKTADGERYAVRITRLVQGFRSPVDAVMRGNRIYVLEYGDNGRLWEVALPPRRADTAVLDEGAQAAVFALAPNFPNPFNAGTAITYRLPAAGMATLRVYNTRGQVVRRLVEAHQQGGTYRVIWDGLDGQGLRVASGTYFAEIAWNGRVKIEKMQLLQ